MIDWVINLFKKNNLEEMSTTGLLQDVHQLITRNELELVEVGREIEKVTRLESERRSQVVAGFSCDQLKRIALREVRSYQKRVTSLESVERRFRENIKLHDAVGDRLEGIIASGMKSISTVEIEEMFLDYQEKLANHRNVMASVDSILNRPDGDDSDVVDLLALEKEIMSQ